MSEGDSSPETADASDPPEELSEEGRARIREGLAEMRRRPDRRAKGLVIVNTGNGKGKTTAALGVLLRAWGRDLRVIALQFLKHQSANWGESRAARKMGIEIQPLGGGFTWMSDDLEKDKALARAGWERCREAIESGRYDVVVLDELTYCFNYGWLDLGECLDVLRKRPVGQHVIITGRDAPPDLIDFADLVTEMREIKHPFSSGVMAQKGIEF
jgi:cob(I)alamin adenosyltransferase